MQGRDVPVLIGGMCEALKHRGPDDDGLWVSSDESVVLGHRRLAIVGLSELGRQPMRSKCGRYVLVFNGEIYNFRELGTALAKLGYENASQTDTEVMLNAFGEWGIAEATRKFSGMFAFAVYDTNSRRLSLARDRFGEKPLYYYLKKGELVFASELRAIMKYLSRTLEIDRRSVEHYLKYGYIPTPHTIYRDIFKALPGTLQTFDLSRLGPVSEESPGGVPENYAFWHADNAWKSSAKREPAVSAKGVVDETDALLRQVVERQMLADVPVGVLLSGGVDSTTIAAVMQSLSNDPIKTFTVGFSEQAYNEAYDAKAVAEYLGTDHTEVYVTADDVLALVPELPRIFDEPFADPSQIPTVLISRLARKHVTVALTGDGGDELFGGYDRYVRAELIRKWAYRWPGAARRVLGKSIRCIKPSVYERLARSVESAVPSLSLPKEAGHKIYRMADLIEQETPFEMYMALLSHCSNSREIVEMDGKESIVYGMKGTSSDRSFLENMMLADTLSYLRDDILTKVDRSSMSVSLESRAPFLDHVFAEYVWGLPLSEKQERVGDKKLLRSVLQKYVPRRLFERPKMGFAVPIGEWLRGPLKEWAEDTIMRVSGPELEFLSQRAIKEKWKEHVSAERNWQFFLWNVLMLKLWMSENYGS